MKLKTIFVLMIMMGGIFVLTACNSAEEKDINKNSTENVKTKYDIHNEKKPSDYFSNDILFTYHPDTNLTIESFDDFTTLTELKIEVGVEAIRQNNDNFYTVYSLKDNQLAYVVLWYSLYTGVDFYIDNILVYPADNVEENLPFLLEKDLPENILN